MASPGEQKPVRRIPGTNIPWIAALCLMVACKPIPSVAPPEPHSIRRIASLSPSCTEMLVSVDGIERLAARTRFCTSPESVLTSRAALIEGFDTPNAEQLLKLKPDLVLASGLTSEATVVQLRRLGLPVLQLKRDRLAGIAEDLVELGSRIDRLAEARREASVLEERLENVRRFTSLHPPKTVLLTFGVRQTFSAGRATFIDDLLTLAGGKNVAAGAGVAWPRLSMEFILAADPEVLLMSDAVSERVSPASKDALLALQQDSFWGRLKAVRQGRVLLIDDARVSVPGPRIAEIAEALAHYLHRYPLPPP